MATAELRGLSETREECWPDWVSKGEVIVDDVSRLNATKVSRVYQARSLSDLQRIIVAAKDAHQVVCVRGTKHSMGGHTMSQGAVVVDMEYIDHMQLSEDRSEVTVGTGAHWSDLIQYLNRFGKAPRTLQSYCSFSVGGTMSVNGHGITTDFCLAESIVSFTLVKHDGTTILCSRTSTSEEAKELFKCVIGGYGLFGIVFEVTLKTNDNVRLFMDTMMVPLNDLPHLYEGLSTANDIEVKLARINITNFDLGEIYIFRRFCQTPTVSNIGAKPLEMSNTSRLLYKWFAGPLREVRFAVEQQLGVALDWSEVVDRNLLLFESAQPLARLYSPLLLVDDTFILQEYFVPKSNFNSWITEAKKIVLNKINQEKLLTLLNITIRVVEHDADSKLPYAASSEGSYAFVFYYRLRRTSEAIQLLSTYHHLLANVTLAEGGTFYLPYQHHYSKEQLLAAYPGFPEFCNLKHKHDPEGLFSNLWWEHYALDKPPQHTMFAQQTASQPTPTHLVSSSHSSPAASVVSGTPHERKKKTKKNVEPADSPSSSTADTSSNDASSSVTSSSASSSPSTSRDLTTPTESTSIIDLTFNMPTKTLDESQLHQLLTGVSTHRSDSFRKLMADPQMRFDFLEVFLTEVLSIGNNTQVFRLINRAIWDPRLKDDDQIYMALLDGLSQSSGPISSLVKAWKNVKQLSDQKKELVRETVSVLNRLGKFGKIHTMASIGDHGKLVVRLRSALNMKGHVWVVHENEGSESDVGAILERGSHSSKEIGEFVQINYEHIRKDGREFPAIPDGVVDLVTMNQGLHHLPPAQIKDFLVAVHRILKPGGIFITREHALDEDKQLMPMLDCAHMVFNALTGVTAPLERGEVRGFRSIMEWRTILESCGFRDTLIYEEQPDDPTRDIMLVFAKVVDGADTLALAAAAQQKKRFSPALTSSHSIRTLTDPLRDSIQLLSLPPSFSTLGPNVALNQLPRIGLTGIKGTLQTLQSLLPSLQEFLIGAVSTFVPKDIPGLAESFSLIIKDYVGPALMMLARFEPLTEAATPNSNFSESYVPEELFLLMQVLRSRSQQGGIFELAIISIIDKIAGKFMNNKKEESQLSKVDSSAAFSDDASPSALAEASEMPESEVRAEMVQLLSVFPELSDLHAVIRGLGLASSASNLICSITPAAGDVDSFTRWAMTKLDKSCWSQLKDGLRAARIERKLPTMDSIKLVGSGWNRSMMAILSSPHIQISRSNSFMASCVGLGDFVTLWSKAQEARQKSATSKPSNRLPSPAQATLDEICPVLHYEGKGELTGVLHVVSARFVKKSLTRIFKQTDQDVTASARMAVTMEGVLDTANIDIDRTLLMGDSKFVIEYRGLPDVSTQAGKMRKIGSQLGQLLASSGHLDGALNIEHEMNTWYKLSEWMQVEVVQMFGDSMNHTPWYRFPFFEVFKVYFQVLFKSVGVVAEKKGYMGAISEKGFLIDMVPGVVMGFLFAQMQLLALPLKSTQGGAYDDSKLVEQLLVMVPSKVSWPHIDKRIVPLTEFDQGLCILQIPTFKPFTEVLKIIANKVPTAIILQISNHSVVQVKMEVEANRRAEETIKAFGSIKGVTVNFNFKFPSVCSNPNSTTSESAVAEPPIYVSLGVQVPSLLHFIRRTASWPNAKIYQVYDFF